WARKSNPCCAFCATAGRKPSSLLARICARQLPDLLAHTCSPITTVRESSAILISRTLIWRTKSPHSPWEDADATADYHSFQANAAPYCRIAAARWYDVETCHRVPAIHRSAAHGIIRALAR